MSFLTKFNFFLCIFAQTYSPIFASDELLTLPDLPPLPDSPENQLSELPLLPGEIDISYLKSLVTRDPQTALVLGEDYLETFDDPMDVPLDGLQDFYQLIATAQKDIGKNTASEYNFAVMDFLLGRSEQAKKNLRKLLDVPQASNQTISLNVPSFFLRKLVDVLSKSDSIRSKLRHSRCLHLMAIVEHSLGNEQEALLMLERAKREIPAKPLPITYNANELPPLPPLPGTPEHSEHWSPSHYQSELDCIQFTNARFKIHSGQFKDAIKILTDCSFSNDCKFDYFLPLRPVYLRLEALDLSDDVLSITKTIPLRFSSNEKLLTEGKGLGAERFVYVLNSARSAQNSGNYLKAEKFLEEAFALTLLNVCMGIAYSCELEWTTAYPKENITTDNSILSYVIIEYFETLYFLGKTQEARTFLENFSWNNKKDIIWAIALRLYKLDKSKEYLDFVPRYFHHFDWRDGNTIPPLTQNWTPNWDSPFPNEIIAGFFLMVNDYDRALKHFGLAIDSERKKMGKDWEYKTAYDMLSSWTQNEKDLEIKKKGIEFKNLSQIKASESLIVDHIKLGNQYFGKSKFFEAQKQFEKALALCNRDENKNEFSIGRIRILKGIGSCLYNLENYEGAQKYFQTGLELGLDSNQTNSLEMKTIIGNFQIYLLETCFVSKKYQEAHLNIQKHLEFRQRNNLKDSNLAGPLYGIYNYLMRTSFLLGQEEEAILNFERTLEEYCKSLGVKKDKLSIWLSIHPHVPDSSVDGLPPLPDLPPLPGLPSEDPLSELPLPSFDEEFVRSIYLVGGLIHQSQGSDEKAIECFRLAGKQPHATLGQIYFEKENFEKAKHHMELAIQKEETLPSLHHERLAKSYLLLGNDENAFKNYEIQIEIDKKNHTGKWNFETPYDRMVRVFQTDTNLDQRRMIPWFEKSFKLHLENNNLADNLAGLGKIHIRLGNYREALQQLDKLPDNYEPYLEFLLRIPEKDRNEKKLNELDAIALKFFKEKFVKQKKLLGELWEFESAYDSLADSYLHLSIHGDRNVSIKESFSRRALNYRQKALQECIQEFGPVHETVGLRYEFIGSKQIDLKQFEDAKRNFDKAIENKSLLGLDSLKIAEYHQTLGNTFDQAGEYEKVVYFYEKALSIYRTQLAPSDSNITNCMNTLAIAYKDWGKTDQAVGLSKQIVTIYKEKKELKLADQEVLWMVQYNLGSQYRDWEDYKSAIEHYSESLKIVTKVLGEDHVRVSDICFRLGGCFLHLGNREMARNYFLKFIEFSEGKRHLIFAGMNFETKEQASFEIISLAGDGLFDEKMYEEAIEFYKMALQSTDLEIAQSIASLLSDIGECYRNLDNKTLAFQYYQKALNARQKAEPKEDDWLAECYLNLGKCSMGENAQEYFKQALAIYAKLDGPKSHNVAFCYQLLGNNASEDKAANYYEHALTIFTELYGYESHALANCYLSMGKTQNALDLFAKIYGQEHNTVANCYLYLGIELIENNESQKAQEYLQKSLNINLKIDGPEGPKLPNIYFYLGYSHHSQKKYEKALSYFEKSHSLGFKLHGDDNEDTRSAKFGIFVSNYALGRKTTAERLANELLDEQGKFITSRFNYLSPSARLDFIKEESPLQILFPFISTENLAEKILQFKGLVLDSVLEDENVARNSQSPEVKNLLIERTALQRSLRFVQSDPTAFEAKALEVQNKLDELNAKIGGLVDVKSREALKVTLEQVAQKIPINTALIEFIEFEEQDLLDLEKDSKARFGAIIILPTNIPTNTADPDSTTRKPVKITLAYKEEVEEHLSAFLNWTSSNNKIYPRNALPALHRLLIKPIIAKLPKEIDSFILSPDGMLSFLPFHALHENPDAPFLSEKFNLFQVTSGRDLLKEFEPNNSKKVVLFGNPEFQNSNAHSADDDLTLASLDPRAESFRDLSFASLPYSQAEVGLLNQLFQKKYQPTAFIGASAKESTLRELNNPRILHLATHGFFIDNPKKISDHSGQSRFFGINKDENSIPNNPMRRAGLALTGAQSTFDAWSKNQRTVSENDGIFTAEEAAMLDLQGTWLTTLSACETGSGSTQAGEGVFGLRRAFYQAGTQNLLLTLWPVNDYRTVDFMKAFYEEALRTKNAPRALAKVQRDFLVNFRKKRNLSQAIKYFAPFVLTFRGPLHQ